MKLIYKNSIFIFFFILIVLFIAVDQRKRHKINLVEVIEGEKVNELGSLNKGNKKLERVIAQVSPPTHGDGKVWEESDYSIINKKEMGIIGIEKGSKKIFSYYSDLIWHQCNKKSKKICVRFPNGQDVANSERLTSVFPKNLISYWFRNSDKNNRRVR